MWYNDGRAIDLEGRTVLKKIKFITPSIEHLYNRTGEVLLQSKSFLQSNSGVSTVEWVALAAGLVIGSILVAYIVMSGLVGAAGNIANQLK